MKKLFIFLMLGLSVIINARADETSKSKDSTEKSSAGAILTTQQNVKKYIQDLKHGTPDIRRSAVYALGDIGTLTKKEVVPVLIEALKDVKEYVRWSAAEVLGEIGDKSAVPALMKALKDESEGVRFYSAKALVKICGKSAVPALTELLKDKNWCIRFYVANFLGNIGDKSVLRILTYVAKNDADENVRNSAKEAIKKINAKASVSSIKKKK